MIFRKIGFKHEIPAPASPAGGFAGNRRFDEVNDIFFEYQN